MRALTLTQPWASLVACGAKKWETRAWRPGQGIRNGDHIAIHAAKGWTMEDREFAFELAANNILPLALYAEPDTDLPLGAVLCVVSIDAVMPTEAALNSRLVDFHEQMLGDFSPGRWAWRLAVVRVFPKPIPARGRLGLWEWTP